MAREMAVTFEDVKTAAGRIEGAAHRTPVMTSRTADAATGAKLFFKCENLQRSGAFKFRGAYNAVSALSDAERASGVVAFSSGNHAQAIALAGSLLGTSTVIVMPTDAPAMKVQATRGYGAEVVLYDRYSEDREAIGRKLASERGLNLIPPFDHPQVIAGQGTAAKELIEEVGPLDWLFTPAGGTGLLAGSALSAAALSPGCKVVGVEPEAGNDAQQSFRSGQIVEIAQPRSIADGALTNRVGDITFPIVKALVHDIATASDAQLVETMRFFAERMKIVVEPTACLGAAAAFASKDIKRGERVGVVISGGNIDMSSFSRLLGG
jgi:threonine dehydratase